MVFRRHPCFWLAVSCFYFVTLTPLCTLVDVPTPPPRAHRGGGTGARQAPPSSPSPLMRAPRGTPPHWHARGSTQGPHQGPFPPVLRAARHTGVPGTGGRGVGVHQAPWAPHRRAKAQGRARASGERRAALGGTWRCPILCPQPTIAARLLA